MASNQEYINHCGYIDKELRERMDELYSELVIYENLANNGVDKARQLAEETLAQMWAVRKQQETEEQEKGELYYAYNRRPR